MTKLVILESPGKIKKVSQFLKEIDSSNNYIVKASIGHVRELSNENDFNMGIDLKQMNPIYKISNDKKQVVNELIEQAKNVKEIIIATDPDREGEAIAFHLFEILKKYNNNFKRMRLNAITKECIQKELNNLNEINQSYVNSAITRQMLDRMVGFRISPILQKTIGAASAGRVQSAVLKILCNRQKEIEAFDKKQYFYIQDEVIKDIIFKNYIYNENNKLVINKIYDKQKVLELKNSLNDSFIVKEIKETKFEESNFKPFSTADLLKAAKSKLKLKTKETTQLAQSLYEKGLITYIRTDSNNLDHETEQNLIKFIINHFGQDKLGKLIKTQTKETDQEGHPAITPTHFEWLVEDIDNYCSEQLSNKEKELYWLIWQNTINSIYQKPSGIKKEVFLENNGSIFYTNLKQFINKGYYEIDKSLELAKNIEFNYFKDSKLNVSNLEIIEDYDKAPSKLNEISLIEQLQKLEIGRPSTYKTAIEVNVLRGYVELEKTKSESMIVNELGLKVNNFLEENFKSIINLDFTKNMEKDLDLIANNKIVNHKQYLKDFYLKLDNLSTNYNFDGLKCSKCQIGYILERVSKKGTKFKGCSNYPNCDFIKFNKPDYSNNKLCEICKNGYMIERSYTDKKTKKTKKFIGCSDYPSCKNAVF
ncbi:type IA DNA topoisomerase [Spiroplasma floricola]|uniref:DNA topoisomerase n=1 Tax=Spiroplasma floricola 23-6 TaxID=1336749 RepID=A0A2K8SF07_9MOLU|nr:DNA topoisomerase [Spiroplasma floricola]AUB32024.1 DNA topoisomerase I [Spiroplasma floricola 23-6]